MFHIFRSESTYEKHRYKVLLGLLLTQFLGLPQSIEIDQKLDRKFRQGYTGAPAAVMVGRKEQEVSRFLCSLPEVGQVASFFERRVGVCPEVAGGAASVVCPPLWWYCVQRACIALCFWFQHLVLIQDPQKWQLNFFPCLFVSFGYRISPNCACT